MFFQSVGEKVRAKWEDNHFYKGTIEEICGMGKIFVNTDITIVKYIRITYNKTLLYTVADVLC